MEPTLVYGEDLDGTKTATLMYGEQEVLVIAEGDDEPEGLLETKAQHALLVARRMVTLLVSEPNT
jgi:hypothetical protein